MRWAWQPGFPRDIGHAPRVLRDIFVRLASAHDHSLGRESLKPLNILGTKLRPRVELGPKGKGQISRLKKITSNRHVSLENEHILRVRECHDLYNFVLFVVTRVTEAGAQCDMLCRSGASLRLQWNHWATAQVAASEGGVGYGQTL